MIPCSSICSYPIATSRRCGSIIGRSVVDAGFRTRFGLTVVGLRRGVVVHERRLLNEALMVGNTLLRIGPWKEIEKLQSDSRDLVIINLPAELDEVLPVPGKALHALVCLALVVALMVSGLIPKIQAALIGRLLMGALGCIDLASAYRAIDWKTIMLIVGMLLFSIALQRTGGVDLAAHALRAPLMAPVALALAKRCTRRLIPSR